MNRNELFRKMGDNPKNDWAELFMVRNSGTCFYISMKNGPYRVQNTPEFENWMDAKRYLVANWNKMYDEEFERQVLLGPEECAADDSAEDSSTT